MEKYVKINDKRTLMILMSLDDDLILNLKKFLGLLYNIKKERNCSNDDYRWLDAASREIDESIYKIWMDKYTSQKNYGISNPKYIKLITNKNKIADFISQLYGGNRFNIRSLHTLSDIITHLEAFLKEFGVNVEKVEKKELKTDKIFIVHGQNKEIKTSVELLLKNIGLEPIILHKQPNMGKTIIEKFEKHSEVGYTVVILTPDDMGCSASEFPNGARSRARQNVILELGYFMGKLERERVAALFLQDKNFEFPTDIFGVIYIPYDQNDSWKYELVDELKSAGFKVSKDLVN